MYCSDRSVHIGVVDFWNAMPVCSPHKVVLDDPDLLHMFHIPVCRGVKRHVLCTNLQIFKIISTNNISALMIIITIIIMFPKNVFILHYIMRKVIFFSNEFHISSHIFMCTRFQSKYIELMTRPFIKVVNPAGLFPDAPDFQDNICEVLKALARNYSGLHLSEPSLCQLGIPKTYRNCERQGSLEASELTANRSLCFSSL